MHVHRFSRIPGYAPVSLLWPAASLLLLGLLVPPRPLHAQDTRTVTEPHLPPTCLTLQASLAAPGGVLAPQSESLLDTARIQQAIDHCAASRPASATAGSAVVLRSAGGNHVFLTGPLALRPGVTLVVSADTVLVASRDPRLYDLEPGSCGVVNDKGHGCRPLIAADHAENSGVMGEGSIDGRGGANLLGQTVTWWDLAHQAKITDKAQSVPWMLVLHHADNFTLYRITLRNSPGFHVAVDATDGFTAWGVNILTPKTARNTDGIDPGSSRNITIEHCFIHTGDDDVAVKSSAQGASSTIAASNISILHNHFFTGHGMSIGSGTSGGVANMLVDDLSIDGADNGIRIKSDRSRGGLVHNILYRDVCIRATRNPLVFTPSYTTLAGTQLPLYRDITLQNIHVVSGFTGQEKTAATYTLLGLDRDHKLGLTLENVFVDDQQQAKILARDAEITIGSSRGNFQPTGPDVSILQTPGSSAGQALACDARFPAFPALPHAPALAATAPQEDKTLYVAADGTGEFSSVQQAVDAAPEQGAMILIAPGLYRETVTIGKPNIHLRSAASDASKTVIVMDKSAGTAGSTGKSATVTVTGSNFFAENITFQNDFNATHPQLPQGSQAVALLVTGDRAVFHNVRVLGNQDTLYAAGTRCTAPNTSPGTPANSCQPARQYFSNCYIEGNVDFIFGDAKTVFDHCELHSTSHTEGFITAQSKVTPQQDSGFVIYRSRLTAEPGVANVWLGRPWRPYATVVYVDTEMGSHIVPAGWREWHPGETTSLTTAYYAEYGSHGPGAHPAQRDPHAHLLSAEQAAQYSPSVFLRGDDHWDPTAAATP